MKRNLMMVPYTDSETPESTELSEVSEWLYGTIRQSTELSKVSNWMYETIWQSTELSEVP